MSQIRCDVITFADFDSGRQETWFVQAIPETRFLQAFPDRGETVTEHLDPVHWQDYWHCQSCSYPDRTGDLRSIVNNADFYSARQWHSTRCGIYRPMGFEHDLMLTLPATSGSVPERGRTMRLFFFRGLGPDFSERDRALLALVRPHLYQACVDAERRRHPVPQLTPGNASCYACWPPGIPTPRSPAASASPREPWAPTWKTSTPGSRSPVVPLPSPAPSPTGLPRAHRPGEGSVSSSSRPFLTGVIFPCKWAPGSARPIACNVRRAALTGQPRADTWSARKAATSSTGLRSE